MFLDGGFAAFCLGAKGAVHGAVAAFGIDDGTAIDGIAKNVFAKGIGTGKEFGIRKSEEAFSLLLGRNW